MAYDEYLADRIRSILDERNVNYYDKKMMGGLTFMVDDKMCVGIVKENLMARIGPDAYEAALEKEGCNEMNFTGRPMKGYVFVEPHVIDLEEDLEYWVQLSLDFNPLAKSSKKKKK
jgi:TfoX/Sxy family transcriptional regulator of competence genes